MSSELGPAANAIRLEWTFGFNKEISGGVHNLSDSTRRAIFYVAGNVGVITDLDTSEQVLLQGHCNMIGCSCVSQDKHWLVTADHGGDDSMIVIWDSFAGTPKTTIQQPEGVLAVDFSPDARLLATVSKDFPQKFSLWDWQNDEQMLMFQEPVPTSDMQHHCRFNPFEPHEIVTNGQKEVVFWSWEEKGSLHCSCPPVASRAQFQQPVANLTQTIYIHDSVRAISATEAGDVVVWDEAFLGDYSVQRERKAMKVLRLCNAKITFLCNLEKCLVLGDAQGRIKFFDSMFRSILWFDDIHAGPVSSISFAQGVQSSTRDLPGSTEEITIPQFVIATTAAKIVEVNADVFDELEPENRHGVKLVDGFSGSIQGVAAHPSRHQVALTGFTGNVMIWDYKNKKVLQTKELDNKMNGSCIVYNKVGTLLAVGSSNGSVKILDADTLEEIPGASPTFKGGNEGITKLVFSGDSGMLAASDAGFNVQLFKWQAPSEGDLEELPLMVWEYIGRAQAHTQNITGLTFKTDMGQIRLVSLGEDRMLVEYEVESSTIVHGVNIVARTRVEQTALATAMVWDEHFGTSDCMVLATDQYKFKFIQTDTLKCVKTVLSPTFGGPVNNMLHVPSFDGGQGNCLAYSTKQKVIGLVQFPLDGNPNKTMGIIAHAGEISSMVVSFDGRYIITAGCDDYCVNVWSAHPASLEKMRRLGGEGVEPFNAMIDGGKQGEFYQEMIDYFYYAQIKAQGEDTTAPRKITGLVPMEQVPDLLRALGVYPSQWDIEDILNEIQAMGDEDNPKTAINFEEFVKLYVNVRPVIGIGKEKIHDAFKVLGAEPSSGIISRQVLTEALMHFGEQFDPEELAQVLDELIGQESLLDDPNEKNISAQEFAENVLGFEDYENDGS